MTLTSKAKVENDHAAGMASPASSVPATRVWLTASPENRERMRVPGASIPT